MLQGQPSVPSDASNPFNNGKGLSLWLHPYTPCPDPFHMHLRFVESPHPPWQINPSSRGPAPAALGTHTQGVRGACGPFPVLSIATPGKSAPQGILSNCICWCQERRGSKLCVVPSCTALCSVPRRVWELLTDMHEYTGKILFCSFQIEFIWICVCRRLQDSWAMPSFRLPGPNPVEPCASNSPSSPVPMRGGEVLERPSCASLQKKALLWLREWAVWFAQTFHPKNSNLRFYFYHLHVLGIFLIALSKCRPKGF